MSGHELANDFMEIVQAVRNGSNPYFLKTSDGMTEVESAWEFCYARRAAQVLFHIP